MSAVSGGALRSFGLFEILDRTFRIYRENFLSMIGIVALVNIPLTIASTLNTLANPSFSSDNTFSSFSGSNASSGNVGAVCLFSVVTIVLSIVQAVIVNGVLTYMTSESHLGRKATIGEAYSAIRHRFTNVGCGLMLFYLIVIALGFGIGVVGALCAPALAGFGVLIYVAIATYAFLIPILTLEDVSTSFGVNRAWGLGKTRFWAAIGLSALIFILSLILTASLTTVAYFLLFQSNSTSMFDTTFVIVQAVLNAIINIVLLPLMPIALTLLYYDTRVRLEGLDIALNATNTPEPRPSDVVSPEPGPFLEGRDFVNMLIIVGITFVIGLIFYQTFQSLLGPEINSILENAAR
jgi:hypothetical protein